MKKNTPIHKVANASVAILISASYIAGAMEDDWILIESERDSIVNSGKPEGKQVLSEQLRDHNYYKEELRKLKESTARIHEEVDRILAEFRKNMEEYYQRTRGTGTHHIGINKEAKIREREEGYDLGSMECDFISGGTPLSLGESPSEDGLSRIVKWQLGLFCKNNQLYCKYGCNEVMITVDKNSTRATQQGLAPDIYKRLMQYTSNGYVKGEPLQFAVNLGNAPITGQHYQEAYGGVAPEDLEALHEFITLCGYTIQSLRRVSIKDITLEERKEDEEASKAAAEKEAKELLENKISATEILKKAQKPQNEYTIKAATHLSNIDGVNENTDMKLVDDLLESIIIFQTNGIEAPLLMKVNFLDKAIKTHSVLGGDENMKTAVAKYIDEKNEMPGGVVKTYKNFLYYLKAYSYSFAKNTNEDTKNLQTIDEFLNNYKSNKNDKPIIVFDTMIDQRGVFSGSVFVGGSHEY